MQISLFQEKNPRRSIHQAFQLIQNEKWVLEFSGTKVEKFKLVAFFFEILSWTLAKSVVVTMASIFIVFRFIAENEKFQAIYRDKR